MTILIRNVLRQVNKREIVSFWQISFTCVKKNALSELNMSTFTASTVTPKHFLINYTRRSTLTDKIGDS